MASIAIAPLTEARRAMEPALVDNEAIAAPFLDRFANAAGSLDIWAKAWAFNAICDAAAALNLPPDARLAVAATLLKARAALAAMARSPARAPACFIDTELAARPAIARWLKAALNSEAFDAID